MLMDVMEKDLSGFTLRADSGVFVGEEQWPKLFSRFIPTNFLEKGYNFSMAVHWAYLRRKSFTCEISILTENFAEKFC